MKKSFLGIGYVNYSGTYKYYTVSFPIDENGRRGRLNILFDEIPDKVEIKRHPSIGKLKKYLNTQEGLEFLQGYVNKEFGCYGEWGKDV